MLFWQKVIAGISFHPYIVAVNIHLQTDVDDIGFL